MRDALGNIKTITDGSVTLQESRLYSPYGEPYGGSAPTGSHTTYGFTGEPTDGTGFVNLRNRYYNPTIGQFFNLDPVETPNRFAYVGGNPVNRTDPTGLLTPLEILLISLIVVSEIVDYANTGEADVVGVVNTAINIATGNYGGAGSSGGGNNGGGNNNSRSNREAERRRRQQMIERDARVTQNEINARVRSTQQQNSGLLGGWSGILPPVFGGDVPPPNTPWTRGTPPPPGPWGDVYIEVYNYGSINGYVTVSPTMGIVYSHTGSALIFPTSWWWFIPLPLDSVIGSGPAERRFIYEGPLITDIQPEYWRFSASGTVSIEGPRGVQTCRYSVTAWSVPGETGVYRGRAPLNCGEPRGQEPEPELYPVWYWVFQDKDEHDDTNQNTGAGTGVVVGGETLTERPIRVPDPDRDGGSTQPEPEWEPEVVNEANTAVEAVLEDLLRRQQGFLSQDSYSNPYLVPGATAAAFMIAAAAVYFNNNQGMAN